MHIIRLTALFMYILTTKKLGTLRFPTHINFVRLTTKALIKLKN